MSTTIEFEDNNGDGGMWLTMYVGLIVCLLRYVQTLGRASVEKGGDSVSHLLLAGNPIVGLPLGSVSE